MKKTKDKKEKMSTWDYRWIGIMFIFALIGFGSTLIFLFSNVHETSLESRVNLLEDEVSKIEGVLTDCQKFKIGNWYRLTNDGITPVTCDKK